MKKSVRLKLEEQNNFYCDYNQDIREDCSFMADNGHPRAGAFNRLRKFFDSLRYASNSSARYYSYKDDDNKSTYWAPQLEVTWYPPYQEFGIGHVYPAMGDVWDEYLKNAALKNWPKSVKPDISMGSFHISTTDRTMMDELHELGFSSTNISPITLKEFYAVRKVIEKYHKGYVLPKRREADDIEAKKELPICDKTFSLANVEEVTVTERKVLVPLIPMDDAGAELALKNVNCLIKLVEQGFPWAQCEGYLEGLVTKKAFKDLQKQFAA